MASVARTSLTARRNLDGVGVNFALFSNTLNLTHPRTIQLLMDSLRYWVLEMHVDGFRFDLAAALPRQLHDVDRLSPSSTSSTRTRS